jgi:hypothetical protein
MSRDKWQLSGFAWFRPEVKTAEFGNSRQNLTKKILYVIKITYILWRDVHLFKTKGWVYASSQWRELKLSTDFGGYSLSTITMFSANTAENI